MKRRVGLAAVAVVMSAAVAGCGGTGGSSGGAHGSISVVASTDVWGDVVQQVAGRLAGSKVQITSIITNPSTDPHSYEANTQNELALSRASVVVENGGGYDDFVATMLASANNASATVIDAVKVSGNKPVNGSLNEHVWYDFPAVQKVAVRVAEALSKADPADAATFRANAAAFDAQLRSMEQTEASIKKAHAGTGVAITEPVPVYLLDACGLVDKTPTAFSKAIEEGNGVSAAVLNQTEQLFDHKQVKLLAYNEQAVGAETDAVLQAARKNNVAVVPVTETLPSGKDYLSWMKSNLAALQSALG